MHERDEEAARKSERERETEGGEHDEGEGARRGLLER